MTVNFEFLGEEHIENVITCLNYQIDKVVLFGYSDAILNLERVTDSFLRKYCGAKEVVFRPLPQNDLQRMLQVMRLAIDHELDQGATVYFDITGGESLILVAFGMLSGEYNVPLHLFDIPDNRLVELTEEKEICLSRNVRKQDIEFDLDMYIELRGGVINYDLGNGLEEILDGESAEDVMSIWEVAGEYRDQWPGFCDYLRNNMIEDVEIRSYRSKTSVVNALSGAENPAISLDVFDSILTALEDRGLIKFRQYTEEGALKLRLKSIRIKELLWMSGRILELYVYQLERDRTDDCLMGVHLDWDGIIHGQTGIDVVNEVDVLSLTGLVPTFISCKGGNLTNRQKLHAMYELDYVAKRFGGKYAKKTLVCMHELGIVYLERASEMGIEVRYY